MWLQISERITQSGLGATGEAWRYIEPHPAQQDIIDGGARFRVLACGRRFGKTDLGIWQLGNAALRTSGPYAYFAPTYKMLADVWRQFKIALGTQITNKNETEKRLEVIGGGSIDFWSLDNPNAARGRKYAGLVIDEAAWTPDLEYAWSFVLWPTLTDYENAWAWFLSTPNGRNYFFALWAMGNDPAKPQWQSWRYPTTANPHIKPEEIEARRELLPKRTFKQEYLAEFTEDGGAVFRNIAACVSSNGVAHAQPTHRYIFGVDWGKEQDFTAIAVIDKDTRQCVHIERFNQIGWSLQRGRLKALVDRYKPQRIIAEENAMGSPNIEALQHEGMKVRPFATTSASKPPLIESLALAFEREELHIVNDPVLVSELQAYTMERLPSGRFRYSAPSGMHDDTVIALALAWHGLNARRGAGYI